MQGTKIEFTPLNPGKYVGRYPIMARSTWELKFMRWCDQNPSVEAWASEAVIVPYISPLDMKTHKYYIDNVVVFKKSDGTKEKYLIEIKPKRQTEAPVPSKKKKASSVIYENATWQINQAKWAAARAYCKQIGWKFMILTEEELF